jgi:microsomal dipeptidase-like Zn-dependent dipeptidase
MKALAELRELRARLTKRFSNSQVDGVMGANWIEFLGRSLPV